MRARSSVRVALAWDAAQQQEAAAEAQFVAKVAEEGAESGKREAVGRDVREVQVALFAQMRECRVNLFDLSGGERVQAIGAVVERGAGPGGAVLHCAHALAASLGGCERSKPS